MSIIHDTIDYRMESIFILGRMCSEMPIEKQLEQSIEKRPSQRAYYEAMYAPSIAIHRHIRDNLPMKDADLHFFFDTIEELDSSLSVVFFPTEKDVGDDKLKRFAGMLSPKEDCLGLDSRQALSDYMFAEGLPYDAIARILLLYDKYDELENIFQDGVNSTETLLRETTDTFAPYAREQMEKLQLLIEEHGFQGMLDFLGIPLSLDMEESMEIYPHIALPNEISMVDNKVYFGVGIIETGKLKRGQQHTEEKVLDVMKALADRTKFQIVGLLSTRQMFGTELAEHFGLTSATISHHIGQLTALGIVTVVKSGNRLYYRTNPETLEDYLQAAKDMLYGCGLTSAK